MLKKLEMGHSSRFLAENTILQIWFIIGRLYLTSSLNLKMFEMYKNEKKNARWWWFEHEPATLILAKHLRLCLWLFSIIYFLSLKKKI
jgi:hypothetical protein